MRLIDADKLKVYRCDDSASRATFDYIYEDDVEDAPTIDLVRCGECKKSYDVGGEIFCNHLSGMVGCNVLVKPTDFCSYGERRE